MRSTFLKNAALLTATSLILRAVGMAFRVYMSHAVGAEGMGLYQLIVSVYVLVSTFATSGISTAVTRLVTDELVRGSCVSVKRLVRMSCIVSLVLGFMSFAVVFLCAKPVSLWFIKDMRAVSALRVLGIGLPFMGLSACLKGYFLARRRAEEQSFSQLIEQACRIMCIWLLLSRFGGDVTTSCACVMIGDTIAEAVSCLFLWLRYRKDTKELYHFLPQKGHIHAILRPLWNIAAPLAAGRYVTSFLHTAENMLVPNRLALFSNRQQALSSFGNLKGMAIPLLFFPASFLSTFSLLLIPEIADAYARKATRRIHEAISRSLGITLWASIGIAGGFFLLGDTLGVLLYQEQEVGVLIKVLAPLIPAMYVESVADGMLKGLDQQVSTLKFHLIDSSLRIALILWAVPRYGMAGFLFVMIVSNTLTAFLKIRKLLDVTAMRFRWFKWVLSPLLCIALPVAVWQLALSHITFQSQWLRIAIAGVSTAAVYLLLSLLTKCLTLDDFRHPKTVGTLSKA